MKKEEILEKARKENKQKDLACIEAENKAVKIAAIAMVFLATIYYALGIMITGKTNYGWYSMIALYCAIVFGIKGIKTKNKFEIICGIIWLLAAVIMIYSYISNLISTSTIL